ncbi:MAG: hypothetical protein BGO74_04475 [Burkholderiales bacterium 68-12]|nr:hypothetical protein [Burkholderiales bacterium]OJX34078.1 MAG: hypothetical protein BGO74_04475 [Burkholderiales bacterium 68-12]
MKDLIRTVLSIRQKRRSPPAGPTPPEGAYVIRGEVRMLVNQRIPRDLWNWMLLSGWRTIPVKKDRRKCMELPPEALLELINAHPAERDIVHGRILARARQP